MPDTTPARRSSTCRTALPCRPCYPNTSNFAISISAQSQRRVYCEQ